MRTVAGAPTASPRKPISTCDQASEVARRAIAIRAARAASARAGTSAQCAIRKLARGC
jgi:hypothetical protein